MATDKKSVLLYCDIIHTVESLSDDEAGKLFKHYLRYINDLNPCAEDRLTTLLFEPIKQNLKRDLQKWESKCVKNSVIAKEGWKKRKDANAYERNKTHANYADKDKETVKDKDKDKDKDKLDFGSLNESMFLWLEYKREKKQSYTPLGLNQCFEKLKKYSGGENSKAMEIIKDAMAKNYSGFFELKEIRKKEVPGGGFVRKVGAVEQAFINQKYMEEKYGTGNS